jgi:signal transduction histidine kinase
MARLLRALARDLSHELRGPVQSILVNLEVLRRRAQNADAQALLERADVIQEETHRLHRLTDAFLELLRGEGAEPQVCAVESLLASLDPLTAMRAKSRHLEFARAPADRGLLVRVERESLQLALLQLFVGVCDALAPGDAVRLYAEPDTDAVVFRVTARGAGAPRRAPIDDAMAAAADWLDAARGTVSLEAGSDSHISLSVRLPRAVLTATSGGE